MKRKVRKNFMIFWINTRKKEFCNQKFELVHRFYDKSYA